MFHIFVLKFRREFCAEIIHFHDHAADAGDEKIVTEHRRNRDAECGDGGNQRARNPRGHRGQIRGTGQRHTSESVHHAPNRSEQAEKGRTAYRGREQNHLRFQLERRFPDRSFHRRVDRVHLGRRNFIGDFEASAKRFVHLGRTKKMKSHFLTASAIHIEDRRAREPRVRLKQSQRLAILPEGREKPARLPSRKLNHAHFRNHDRPAENRADAQKSQDELGGDRRMLERENKAARRKKIRSEHVSQLAVVIAEFGAKRKQSLALPSQTMRDARCDHAGFISRDASGKNGLLARPRQWRAESLRPLHAPLFQCDGRGLRSIPRFLEYALKMKPAPMTMRKIEKN